MPGVALTWLGHGGFRFDSPGGKRIYVDPWLDNPKCPDSEKRPERIDILALTHGHFDHVGNAVALAQEHRPKVVAIFDLAAWIEKQGVEGAGSLGMNKGGTQEVDGIRFTLTDARHSSGLPDGTYGGEACGFVIGFEDGTTVYVAGDTAVFGDMQLIGRLYRPDVAVLPIGDHFTMGPREAALALELLGVSRCVPGHYATFPLLTGTPDQLREAAPNVEVIAPEPGETITL